MLGEFSGLHFVADTTAQYLKIMSAEDECTGRTLNLVQVCQFTDNPEGLIDRYTVSTLRM